MRGSKLLLWIAPAVLLAGCSWGDSLFSPEQKIRGAWVYDDASYGKPELVFRKDHVYQIDLEGDGSYEIAGEYGFTERHLRLRSTEGGFSEQDCRDGGFYSYVVKGDNLSFEYYADQCKERTAFLSHTWIRKEIRDEQIRQAELEAQRKAEEERRQAEMEARKKAVKEQGEVTRRRQKKDAPADAKKPAAKKPDAKADAEQTEYQPVVNFTHR